MTRLIPVEKAQIGSIIRRHSMSKNEALFTEFINMEIPAAKLEWKNEWSSVRGAYNNLWKSSKRFSDLPISVVKRGDEIYLIRIDM